MIDALDTQILEACSHESMTPKQISTSLDQNPKTIRRRMKKLTETGDLKCVGQRQNPVVWEFFYRAISHRDMPHTDSVPMHRDKSVPMGTGSLHTDTVKTGVPMQYSTEQNSDYVFDPDPLRIDPLSTDQLSTSTLHRDTTTTGSILGLEPQASYSYLNKISLPNNVNPDEFCLWFRSKGIQGSELSTKELQGTVSWYCQEKKIVPVLEKESSGDN